MPGVDRQKDGGEAGGPWQPDAPQEPRERSDRRDPEDEGGEPHGSLGGEAQLWLRHRPPGAERQARQQAEGHVVVRAIPVVEPGVAPVHFAEDEIAFAVPDVLAVHRVSHRVPLVLREREIEPRRSHQRGREHGQRRDRSHRAPAAVRRRQVRALHCSRRTDPAAQRRQERDDERGAAQRDPPVVGPRVIDYAERKAFGQAFGDSSAPRLVPADQVDDQLDERQMDDQTRRTTPTAADAHSAAADRASPSPPRSRAPAGGWPSRSASLPGSGSSARELDPLGLCCNG